MATDKLAILKRRSESDPGDESRIPYLAELFRLGCLDQKYQYIFKAIVGGKYKSFAKLTRRLEKENELFDFALYSLKLVAEKYTDYEPDLNYYRRQIQRWQTETDTRYAYANWHWPIKASIIIIEDFLIPELKNCDYEPLADWHIKIRRYATATDWKFRGIGNKKERKRRAAYRALWRAFQSFMKYGPSDRWFGIGELGNALEDCSKALGISDKKLFFDFLESTVDTEK